MFSLKSISFFLFFFFFGILNIFNTHTHGEWREIFLKKLIVVYIKKGLTLGYTATKKKKKEKKKKEKKGALVLVVLKKLAFNNSKNYFIYFNTSLYNTLNINDSIFFTTFLKYYFFIHFLFFFHASFSLFLSISLSLIWRFWRITSKATATSIVTYNLQPTPLPIAKPQLPP